MHDNSLDNSIIYDKIKLQGLWCIYITLLNNPKIVLIFSNYDDVMEFCGQAKRLAYKMVYFVCGFFLYNFICKGAESVEEKQRVIQEYVPGRQITLAHIISNPVGDLCRKIGFAQQEKSSLAILTITPSEAAIIAADIATKAADIQIVFVDRFSGSLVVSGDTSSCEAAVNAVVDFICKKMGFAQPEITRS